ncbi:MAG: hypothetical protein ABIE92_06230 [bacterium]
MQKNSAKVFLTFLMCLNPSKTQGQELPTFAEVRVVHPVDNDGEGFVHIRLRWDNDPGFVSGQALEIGLVVDPKHFAIPEGGNDKLPTRGYVFTRDGKDMSCDYRDILNYSNASSWEEAIALVQSYCGIED